MSASYKIKVLSVGLLISVLFNTILWFYPRDSGEPHYYKSDQRYVDQAISLWAQRVNEKPPQAMSFRYAQAIYVGQELCISLMLKQGSVGGVPTYCFDRDRNVLTRRYEDDE